MTRKTKQPEPGVTIGGIDEIMKERHRERLEILRAMKDVTYQPPSEPLPPEWKIGLPVFSGKAKRPRRGK